jgi:hypothetical protein
LIEKVGSGPAFASSKPLSKPSRSGLAVRQLHPGGTGQGTLSMRMISPKKLGVGALMLVFSAILVGCEPAGPAEKAGRSLDKAGDNLKDAVNPKGPGEKLGEKLDKATGNN